MNRDRRYTKKESSMKLCKAMFMNVLLVLAAALFLNGAAPVLAAETANTSKKVQKKAEVLVASKEGGKYHKASCSLVKNIKPENKVTFKSKVEAEKSGYKPCAVCKP